MKLILTNWAQVAIRLPASYIAVWCRAACIVQSPILHTFTLLEAIHCHACHGNILVLRVVVGQDHLLGQRKSSEAAAESPPKPLDPAKPRTPVLESPAVFFCRGLPVLTAHGERHNDARTRLPAWIEGATDKLSRPQPQHVDANSVDLLSSLVDPLAKNAGTTRQLLRSSGQAARCRRTSLLSLPVAQHH